MSSTKLIQHTVSRRRLILLGVAGIAGPSVLLSSPQVSAQGGNALPHVDVADPTARALGYVDNAATVDKAKFPSFKSGAHCATCNFFQGKATDAYGPCQIFPGKSVASAGWCASHSPKA